LLTTECPAAAYLLPKQCIYAISPDVEDFLGSCDEVDRLHVEILRRQKTECKSGIKLQQTHIDKSSSQEFSQRALVRAQHQLIYNAIEHIAPSTLLIYFNHTLSVLTAIYPREPELAGVTEAKDDRSGNDNWIYKSRKAPIKSSPPTNQHPTFTGRMPFLSPNQQCQSTEGKIYFNHSTT